MTWVIVAIAAVILGFVVFRNLKRSRPALPASQLLAPGSASIAISGWSETEGRRILNDFAKLYTIPAGSLALRKAEAGRLDVSFPAGIASDHFLFLVNYLNYPADIDLDGRSLGIAGWASDARLLGLDVAGMSNIEATVYVPDQDTEFDQVATHLGNGQSYLLGFAAMAWKVIAEPRMPRTLESNRRQAA